MKRVIPIVIAAVALSSCSSKPGISGTWIGEASSELPPGTQMQLVLTEPDKMGMILEMSSPNPTGKKMVIRGEVKGTYKMADDQLTFHADTATFSSEGFPDVMKAQMDKQLKDMSNGLVKELNETGAQEYKRIDADTFSIKGPKGKAQLFRRKTDGK